jgi:hypothetical protein
MTGWMKRLYSPPLHFVASFVPLDRIRSLSQRTAEIIEKLKVSLMVSKIKLNFTFNSSADNVIQVQSSKQSGKVDGIFLVMWIS